MNGNILPWTQSPGEGMLFRQENTLRWAGIEELIDLGSSASGSSSP